ncbi:TIR domain-containing protein [Panacibacter ginsenosidivorans]|uniref:TIR domain-containing protein n=1 Tax=Panacibacter ginsenosidivorans TaxID=1813871 RepID=A0A5B8VCH5_9BACT|nr:CD225/dispanin family protein [Panacibacter ginsenosidivorans]QEC67998.1 TIR domain-containing protein [Panacibacter ginsenosidivorans]
MSNNPGTIFINYRKDDSNWNALALYNDLQKYFKKEQLFKDFNAILPGDDFVVSIQNALNKCNVLLVVIGRNWLHMEGADGKRRLDDPDDFVRLEVATALERGISVVPVLFDGTPMPKPEELPENLRLLCRRQFIEIDPKRFEDDVRNLAEALKKILPKDEEQVHPKPGPQPQPKPNPPNPGNQGGTAYHTTPKPDNNLLWGILVTILCCLPLGIVSIIHATKVDGLYNTGQYEQAVDEAKKAKQWAMYGAIAGIVVYVIYFLLVAAGSLNSYSY